MTDAGGGVPLLFYAHGRFFSGLVLDVSGYTMGIYYEKKVKGF